MVQKEEKKEVTRTKIGLFGFAGMLVLLWTAFVLLFAAHNYLWSAIVICALLICGAVMARFLRKMDRLILQKMYGQTDKE